MTQLMLDKEFYIISERWHLTFFQSQYFLISGHVIIIITVNSWQNGRLCRIVHILYAILGNLILVLSLDIYRFPSLLIS